MLADDLVIKPAARTERSLIAGMLQQYLGEMSPFTGQQASGNGRYLYPQLDDYWEDDTRIPFLFEHGSKVVGFALVRKMRGGSSVPEFFVKAEYRHNGFGRTAAHALFHHFPGRWAVRQLLMNTEAQAFWRKIVGEVDPQYEERIDTSSDGRTYTIQRFSVLKPIDIELNGASTRANTDVNADA